MLALLLLCGRRLTDISYSTRLKNIEETEKDKRQMSEQRRERTGKASDEAHLAAARCKPTPVRTKAQF